MTAAATLHEKVRGKEDIAENTELRAELVNDNLFFYPGSGTAKQ